MPDGMGNVDNNVLSEQIRAQGFVTARLRIVNGANAGTFAIRYKTNSASNAAKIWDGSFLRYRKVASSA